MRKTLHNSDASGASKNVKDIKFFGNGDTFQLLCKASSEEECWMKSTKAMDIKGVGCVVQVTTQQGDHVTEALTFVPGVRIEAFRDTETNEVVGRKLVAISHEYGYPEMFKSDVGPHTINPHSNTACPTDAPDFSW